MLFISGMVSRAGDGRTIEGRDEYEQAKVIFGKIRSLVEAAGGAMADVVKMTIYVVNIKNNTEVWRARQEFFSADFPCSTLVEVRSLATPEILVEIEAIACIGPANVKRQSASGCTENQRPSLACPNSSFGGSYDKNRFLQDFSAEAKDFMPSSAERRSAPCSCFSFQHVQRRDKLVFGWSAIAGSQAVPWIMKEAGLYEKHGLDRLPHLSGRRSQSDPGFTFGDVPIVQGGGNSPVAARAAAT
jgi:enamine deaminase RidA (YjgF/YER057c/UK114 family)